MEYYGRVKSYDVAVIGAGHNGLACAALLAKAGHSVAVFENNPVLGGATLSERDVWPGYTLSTASYVCSLLDPALVAESRPGRPWIFRIPKGPDAFTPLADGRSLLLGSDAAANAREIAAFVRARRCRLAGRTMHGSRVRVGRSSSRSPTRSRASTGSTPKRKRRCAARPLDSSSAFSKRRSLQAKLATDGLIGTYLGPRDPGTGYVLAHHCRRSCAWHPRRVGFRARRAWARSRARWPSAARAHGAEIFDGAPVAQISLDGEGRANGVVLGDGREVAATRDRVQRAPAHDVCEPGRRSGLGAARFGRRCARRKLRAWKTVGPSLKAQPRAGRTAELRRASRHRAAGAPSRDDSRRAVARLSCSERTRARARRAKARTRMIECFLQTPTEPDLAPPGKHILSIFAQYFPYDRDDGWTPGATRGGRRQDRRDSWPSTRRIFPARSKRRQLLAPPDLEARFGLVGGHIFHGELLPGQIYEERFATRTPVRGLYLCGSGAHPGRLRERVPRESARPRRSRSTS